MKNDRFTPAQREAIDSDSPNIMVIAGPGSGKSSTLVARIRRLVADGVDPQRMAAITFTNAAARELEHKLNQFVAGPDGIELGEVATESNVYFPIKLGATGTLHSFALRMLKEHGDCIGYGSRLSVISPESADDLLATKARALGCKMQMDELRKLKQSGRPTGPRLDVPHTVIASYFDDLRAAGIVDFDLILSEFRRLIFTGGPDGKMGFGFTYLFVDEVQDLAEIDWFIFDHLDIDSKFFVGDPDQNLFSFRGARVEIMLEKAKWFPFFDNDDNEHQVIRLEDNFRSHSEITEAAQRLIEHNTQRIAKETRSVKGPGGYVINLGLGLNEGSEIGMVANEIKSLITDSTESLGTGMFDPSQIAVIGRTNAIVNAFQKTLVACGLPVAVEAKHNLPRDWPKTRALVELLVQPENDTLALFYLTQKLVANGCVQTEVRRDAAETKRYCNSQGKTLNQHVLRFFAVPTIDRVPALLAQEGCSMESRMLVAETIKSLNPNASMIDLALALAQVRDRTEKITTEGIRCLTFHGSKGLEFDVVFLVGMEQEIIPGTRKGMTALNIEEERRMCYVGMTRARKRLYLSWAQTRITPWNAYVEHRESQFQKEAIAK